MSAAVWRALAAEGTGTAASVPIFAPDSATAWVPDRPTGDDFLPPVSGPDMRQWDERAYNHVTVAGGFTLIAETQPGSTAQR